MAVSESIGESVSLIDPDIGMNSIQTYHLRESEYFDMKLQNWVYGSRSVDLILKKRLNREQYAYYNVILVAVDGGILVHSSSASIIVHVLHVSNDTQACNREIDNICRA